LPRAPRTSPSWAAPREDCLAAKRLPNYTPVNRFSLREAQPMVVTIVVSNMDRAVAFYTDVLNCKIQFRFGNEWAQLRSLDGTSIGLHPASEKNPAGVKGSIQIGISVEDGIERVVEQMKAQGVKFTGPVVDDKEVLLASFEDPDGNPFYLAQPKLKWDNFDLKSNSKADAQSGD
jgi:predicted enzyme related to lactoylglutathione lyase